MPPEQRVVPRFVAEPPQEGLPYGRWEQRLRAELLGACLGLGEGEDLGEPGEIVWYPDRSWHGRTYVPASTITARGYELFGYVRFLPARAAQSAEGGKEGRDAGGEEPRELYAHADFTEETAERNPGWTLDLCDETIGSWRGPGGAVAAMTLVWGRPLRGGGRVATAELGGVTVDQCELIEQRFTLIAPDDYRGELLEIALYGGRGQEIARESLYASEGEGEEEWEGEGDGAAGDAQAGAAAEGRDGRGEEEEEGEA